MDFCARWLLFSVLWLLAIGRIENAHIIPSENEFPEVVKEEPFLKFDFERMIDLLKSDDLNVDESIVFEKTLNWVKRNTSEREKFLPDLLKEIRWSELGVQVIASHAEDFPDNNGFLRILNRALICNNPNLSLSLSRNCPASQARASYNPDIVAIGPAFTGNTKIELYSGVTNQWTVIATLNDQRRFFGAVWLNYRVIIVGGFLSESRLNSVVSVDLKTRTISDLAPLSEPRDELSVIEFNGFVYAVGGVNNDHVILSSVDRYDPKSNEWQSVAAMSQRRCHAALVQFNGSLCAIGGWDNGDLRSVECYDPSTDRWSTKASMIKPRRVATAIAMNGYIYVAGGRYESGPRTIERYDPTTDSWTVIDTLNVHSGIGPWLFRKDGLFAFNRDDGTFYKYNLGTKEWKELAALKAIRDPFSVFITRT